MPAMSNPAGKKKLKLPEEKKVVGLTSKGHKLVREEAQRVVFEHVEAKRRGTGEAQPPRLLPIINELRILDKERGIVRLGGERTLGNGTVVPQMNYAQLQVVLDAERQLRENGNIRTIVLKARQIGISTIIEAIAFTMAQLYEDLSALIVSHEAKSTRGILAMTKRYWNTYVFQALSPMTRYDSAMHLSWVSGSSIQVATAKTVDAGRSSTLHFLHASEVAFWPDPETLFTGLRQAVPTFGLSAIFMESTANGIGNFFYAQCNEAMKGKSEYKFFFFPWHEHPEYRADYLPKSERTKYASLGKLDDEERVLVQKHHVAPEQLMWRRWAIVNLCQNDIDKFHQEYPSTEHEAFVSTGRNVFAIKNLLAHYDPLVGVQGKLISTPRGPKFVEDDHGPLTIFAEPSSDKDWGIYVLGGDPTHTTAGDNACIQVLNRRTMEQVAVYRRKVNGMTFGKDMQLLGLYYNTGLLAPERTGPGSATAGCISADYYPNVYITQNVAKQQGQPLDGIGWVTSRSTKHYAISQLTAVLADDVIELGTQRSGLIIHDQQTFQELRDYVTTEDGQSYTNGDGSPYDDGVMSLAIAVSVHFIEGAVPPYVVREDGPRATRPVVQPRASGSYDPKDDIPKDKRVGQEAAPDLGVEPLDIDPEDDSTDIPLPWEDWKDNNDHL